MDTFEKTKAYLLSKQQEIADKLKLLEEEQSLSSEATPESMELGTYAWEAEAESTKAAVYAQLLKFSRTLKETLSKFNQGTYGFCDRCRKKIDEARLEVLPTATLCITCVV